MRYVMTPVVSVFAFMASLSAGASPQTYQIVPAHVGVLFAIDHLGFSLQHGSFRAVAGTLSFDADHPEASQVSISIKTDSIDTAHAQRDADLKSEGFLDAVKYPEIEFTSTAITTTGPNTFKVVGNLKLHGVTLPIELQAKLNGVGKNPFDNKPTIGFSVSGSLKRSDFGVSRLMPAVGDLVTITIDAEFNQ